MFDLLICNGVLPYAAICDRLVRGAHSITCADGGANKARDYGIRPGVIIGDLDSIRADTLSFYDQKGVEIIHLQRQDDTDFEKALKMLVERGAHNVVILGLTGGLLDHTLGNLSILQRYIDKLKIVIYDPDYRIDVITEETEFATEPGSRISIVPLRTRAEDVKYTGLQYRLPDDLLVDGENEGTCNRAIEDRFTVSIGSGAVMVFRPLTLDIVSG